MENKPRRRRPVQSVQPEQPDIPREPVTSQPSEVTEGSRRRAQGAPVVQAAPPHSNPAQPPRPPRPAAAQPERAEPPRPPRKPGKKKKKKKNKNRWLILIIIILLLLLIALGVIVYKVNERREFERYVFDTEAIEGRIQTMTEEEIQEELNRVVDEGMFNISIASSIVFDSKTKQGQARIENIAANHYHMQVDIFLNDTQELVYSSKLLRPGYALEYIELDKQLPPGEYEATAIFSAITQKELQLFGQAGAEIKLYITDENGSIPSRAAASTAAP